MKRMLIAALLLCVCLSAQTPTWIYIWANGKAGWAQLDPATVKLDTSVSPPVLRAITTPPLPAAPDFLSLAQSQAVFTVKCASVIVFRNGILQSPGADYAITGTTLTFKPGDATPQPGDLIAILYRCPG